MDHPLSSHHASREGSLIGNSAKLLDVHRVQFNETQKTWDPDGGSLLGKQSAQFKLEIIEIMVKVALERARKAKTLPEWIRGTLEGMLSFLRMGS